MRCNNKQEFCDTKKMLPLELKELIDKYCTGVQPTVGQLDDILSVIYFLEADAKEAMEYMQIRMASPTKEEEKGG